MRKQSIFLYRTLAIIISLLATTYAHAQVMPSMAPILKNIMPAVVNIKTVSAGANSDNYKQQPVPPAVRQRNPVNMASGVIIDHNNGTILTNAHVIHGAEEISVTLSDGRQVTAEVIGSDPESDIAVIHINANNLTSIPLGNSEQLAVGDFVLAIGNPFGLNQSVTSGIVSALGRDDLGIEGYENFIQTDASINPGNSGGALIDLNGKLIGINTAIIAPEGGNIGIGFAIPINMANSIMKQIIKFGQVRRGLLGVIAQPLTPELATAFNADVKHGAIISHVAPNGLAASGGIKVGDLIYEVNNKAIDSAADLRNSVSLIPINNSFSVSVLRHNKRKTIKLHMRDPRLSKSPAQKIFPKLAGAEFGQFSGDLPGHGFVQGLKVLRVAASSPFAHFGFKNGDIIVSANQEQVASMASLAAAAKKRDDLLLVNVIRGIGSYFVVLK